MNENQTLFDLELTTDDGQHTIPLRFDEKTARRAANFRDALLVARSIPEESEVTPADPVVILLASAGYSVADAVKAVQREVHRYAIAALNDALEAALFEPLFTQRIEGSRFVIDSAIPVEVSDDAYDDSAINAERAAVLLPPLPKRKNFHPVEQRAMLAKTILRANPILSARFNRLYEKGISELVQGAVDGGTLERDDAGFHPGGLGADSSEAARPNRKERRATAARSKTVRTGTEVRGEES